MYDWYFALACNIGNSYAHTDTTYIIFDGDKDYWAYARMKGWTAYDELINADAVFYGQIVR
jgi:hypothetical protein